MFGERIAREIRDAHRALHALARRLEADMTAARTRHGSLRESVRALTDCLRRHFELEEEGGFMEEVLRRWPHASMRADALRSEHERLLQEAEHLARAEDMAWEMWARAALALLAAIREHEQKENRLIQDVFSLDIGGEG